MVENWGEKLKFGYKSFVMLLQISFFGVVAVNFAEKSTQT